MRNPPRFHNKIRFNTSPHSAEMEDRSLEVIATIQITSSLVSDTLYSFQYHYSLYSSCLDSPANSNILVAPPKVLFIQLRYHTHCDCGAHCHDHCPWCFNVSLDARALVSGIHTRKSQPTRLSCIVIGLDLLINLGILAVHAMPSIQQSTKATLSRYGTILRDIYRHHETSRRKGTTKHTIYSATSWSITRSMLLPASNDTPRWRSGDPSVIDNQIESIT